jgi:hypothetical protein
VQPQGQGVESVLVHPAITGCDGGIQASLHLVETISPTRRTQQAPVGHAQRLAFDRKVLCERQTEEIDIFLVDADIDSVNRIFDDYVGECGGIDVSAKLDDRWSDGDRRASGWDSGDDDS